MSRIFTTGFESRNLAYEVGTLTGVPTISTSKAFRGVASMECNAAGAEVSARMYANLGAATDLLHRVYLYFVTFPASLTKVIQLQDAGGDHTSIRVNTSGTLELWNDPGAAQFGSDSAALSANTWYRIEIACGTTHAGNDVQALINGVEFASSATHPSGADHRGLEVGVMGAVTCDMYVDGVASNDTTGTTNNLFPGEDFSLNKTLYNSLRPNVFTPGLAR